MRFVQLKGLRKKFVKSHLIELITLDFPTKPDQFDGLKNGLRVIYG